MATTKSYCGNELVEDVGHDPRVVVVGDRASGVQLVVVAVDLSVQVVVHDCVGDELAATHVKGLPVELVRVEDFVFAGWDAGVDVYDEDFALEWFGPCWFAATLEVLSGGVDVAWIRGINPYGIEKSHDCVAESRLRCGA
jgi:hypothetical protein